MIPANLMQIYNDLGFTDLELSKTRRDKEGSILFSKWHRFEELMSQDNVKFEEYTERRIADVEIVLDYDEYDCPKCYQSTSKNPCLHCDTKISSYEQKDLIMAHAIKMITRLKKDKIKYQAYITGSKGVHVHTIWPELRSLSKRDRESFKEQIIIKYKAEKMKKVDRCMIMIEGQKHRKTGRVKELFEENKGYNYIL